jgi:hypothetical protein
MPLPSSIIGLFCRFAVIYILLIIPWPGWNDLYGQYFRALGELAFTRESGDRVVKFVAHDLQHGFSTLNSQMIVGNRALANSSGKGVGEVVDLDTRSIGWVPTALIIALVLATPVPWKRRAWSLLWGFLLVQVLILFTLQVRIWVLSPRLSLATFSPFWTRVLDDLDYTLLVQLGASFSVPVLIWILVTFRRKDISLASAKNQT